MNASARGSLPMGYIVDAPFDLRGDWNQMDSEFFDTVFPGNTGYMLDSMFLYVFIKHTPEPRPRVFAGIPVIIVTKPSMATLHSLAPPALGEFPRQMATPPGFMMQPRQGSIAEDLSHLTAGWRCHAKDRPSSCPDFDFDLAPCVPLVRAVRTQLDSIQTPITEVIFFGHHILVTLKDNAANRSTLPFRAGGLVCRYVLESEVNRKDQHRIETTGTINCDVAPAKQYQVVTFDTPDGPMYGQVLGLAEQLTRDGKWVLVYYIYIGEDLDNETFKNGTTTSLRGTAIWGLDGKLIGHFQYYVPDGVWEGWCIATAAEAEEEEEAEEEAMSEDTLDHESP